MYVIFEGIVGTGKSTQSKKLHEYLCAEYIDKEVIWTREPGGTEIAEAIRVLVQGTKFEEEMDSICEAYLYAASRAQALRKVVKPVLEKDGIVVSDRSFITALAYQGYVRKLGVDTVLEINRHAVDGIYPDIIFYLDMPIKMGLSRTFDKDGDKWEGLGEDFFVEVEKAYAEVAKLPLFEGKWVNIDATGTKKEVFEEIVKAYESFRA